MVASPTESTASDGEKQSALIRLLTLSDSGIGGWS